MMKQRKEIERRRHVTRGRRIYEWLAAVLWVAGGKHRFDIADLLGYSVRQVTWRLALA
jgi:DNA-binding CsgD family transcriptional regulator